MKTKLMQQERSSDVQLAQFHALRNRKPSHSRSHSNRSTMTTLSEGMSHEYGTDVQEGAVQNQMMVDHYKGPIISDDGWLARIAALLVGEDPTQCIALICGHCHTHNGVARKEDYPYITYYCPHCHALNGWQHVDDNVSGSSSCISTPLAPHNCMMVTVLQVGVTQAWGEPTKAGAT